MHHLPQSLVLDHFTAHLFPAAWLSSLWRCSSLVESHTGALKTSGTTTNPFFVPLDSTPKAEVIKAQKANNLLGVPQSLLGSLKPPTLWDRSWNFPGMALPRGSSHQVLKAKSSEPCGFLRDCSLLVGQYPKGGASPKPAVSIQ